MDLRVLLQETPCSSTARLSSRREPSSFSVGLIGDWAHGEYFQNQAHKAFNIRTADGSIKQAKGWPHQMKREVGISISNRIRRRFYERSTLVTQPDGTQAPSRYIDTVLDNDITLSEQCSTTWAGV